MIQNNKPPIETKSVAKMTENENKTGHMKGKKPKFFKRQKRLNLIQKT